MTCYYPLDAFKTDDGRVIFHDRGGRDRPLLLSCGQCIGCKLRRSMDWAVRCVHESRMHKRNCFVTLTYDPKKVPHGGTLVYAHFQDFLKRLRFNYAEMVLQFGPVVEADLPRIRFFMGGEYGEEFYRPHYHACLFGVDFAFDRQLYKVLRSGHRLYTSEFLAAAWQNGFCSLGDVSFQSAAYVARYCTKKVSGKVKDEGHYERFCSVTGEIFEVVPEFGHMSLKPGIGASFMDAYASDVFPEDRVILNGGSYAVPKYYDKYLTQLDKGDLFDVEYQRYLRSLTTLEDCSIDRLRAREIVTRARLSFRSINQE